ncbi:MAG: RNA methyltransferase [Candidatus Korarchaeota archaeon]|nr:RNA methyltransferase [Thermoproteota archaeon]MCR8463564.1 RNA methyltransferase [Thermoproteota archaeon]MCR8470833.1 RNA methyltransferase [Thermoproteota archaeon]MCR8472529.1 RNA methyltransferase [Thermoproteota archaeon]MCR8488344.1 RNA methyltransferase [Thermoproteota archaeon]
MYSQSTLTNYAENVYFVLVETKYPGNIGLSARAIKNFGFKKLVLIKPLTEIGEQAIRRAMRARDVLIGAKIYETLDEFINSEKIDFLLGTTAKVGSEKNPLRIAIPIDSLRGAILPQNSRIAILFGNEERGLSNRDLEKCDLVITVPTSPAYPSLNLSHAVAICAYELSLLAKTFRELPYRPATHLEREILIRNVLLLLDMVSEKLPEPKKEIYRRILINFARRAFLTGREAHSLIGFTKMIIKKLQKSSSCSQY